MKTDTTKKLLSGLGFFLGFYILAVIVQSLIFTDRFGSFSHIANVDVSYLTTAAAKTRLEKVFTEYSTGKMVIGGDIVVAGDYVKSGRIAETVDEAVLAEQRGYFNFSKLKPANHQMDLEYNDLAITKLLFADYDKLSVVPVDANIDLNSKVTIVPEKNGQRLLLTESRQKIQDGLAVMNANISLKVVSQAPGLTALEAAAVVNEAQANVADPITLLGAGTSYTISASDLRSWLKITPERPESLVAIENFLPPTSEYYFLNPSKVLIYVDNLAKGIDKPALNAKLAAVAGKVTVSAPEQVGRTVDRKDAILQIQRAVTGERVAELKISTIKPEIRADNLVELGLVELISTGTTDFSGSSASRVHNVTVGAARFNGVLMKPGEDFSFNKTLGPVDAITGYLPELVILADKTVPEYGGGLCQVSSTAFRAALNAGLPILERYAHGYPVSYYKPYGVDATIYLPNPDLRYKNDTGKYVLIQTRIEGKKLFFDFYGTKKPVRITFSGNEQALGAVDAVEKITPSLTELGARGPNSFTATFYRHVYDMAGKLIENKGFTSKYDSPDKYPH